MHYMRAPYNIQYFTAWSTQRRNYLGGVGV
jgi:hypothetical protein